MTIRELILAVKYWLQGDKWGEARKFAKSITRGFKRYDRDREDSEK